MSDIQITTRDGLVRALTITIKADEIQSSFQSKLAKYAKEDKIDGFRPGKVPAKILEKKFGDSIRGEVLNELMQKGFEKAIEDKAVKMAGMPQVEEGEQYKPGEDFTFTTTFEVYPEISLNDYNGVEIEKQLAEVTEKDIENMLEKLRKQHSDWTDADESYVAKDGDRMTVDFEGFIGDEPFEGGKAEGYQLQLGSNTMIPGFEEGLVGAKLNETKTLNLEFPEEYHAKELAGKATRFEVAVKKLEVPALPELNDEFAKKMQIEGGIEKLRAEVQKNMGNELKQALHNRLKEQVLDKLIEVNPIDVPSALIESEVDGLVKQSQAQFKQYTGIQDDSKLPPIDRNMFTEQGKKRVILGLLLSEVIKKFELKASPEAIDAKIDELAQIYEDPKQIKNYYQQNKNAMAEIETLVLEELATEKLLAEATVTEKQVSYEDALKRSEAEDKSE